VYVCVYIYTCVHKAASTGDIFFSQDPALLVAHSGKQPVEGVVKFSLKPSSGLAWMMILYFPPEAAERVDEFGGPFEKKAQDSR